MWAQGDPERGSTLGGCRLGGCWWSAPARVHRCRAGASPGVGVQVQHPRPGRWGAKLGEAPVELRLPLRCQDPARQQGGRSEQTPIPHPPPPKNLLSFCSMHSKWEFKGKTSRSADTALQPHVPQRPAEHPQNPGYPTRERRRYPSEDRQGWQQATASLTYRAPKSSLAQDPLATMGQDSTWHPGGHPCSWPQPQITPCPGHQTGGSVPHHPWGVHGGSPPPHPLCPHPVGITAVGTDSFLEKTKPTSPSPSGDALGTHSSYRQTAPKPPAPNPRRDINKQGTKEAPGSKSNPGGFTPGRAKPKQTPIF